jgi:hypothetical protein
LINPADLKEVSWTRKEKGNTMAVTTSQGTRSFKASKYTINDKIRPALSSRYNVLTVDSKKSVSMAQNHGKRNWLLQINGPSKSTIIFPKAVKSVEVRKNQTRVDAYTGKFTIPTPVGAGAKDALQTLTRFSD